jgi:hypothetical protein
MIASWSSRDPPIIRRSRYGGVAPGQAPAVQGGTLQCRRVIDVVSIAMS